jgi:PAS domain S-box-containing protein
MLSQFALPDGKWRAIIPLIAFPYLVIFPIAFALVCLLFLENEQIARTTSELIESEARYRTLFENRHTVMLIIDPSTGTIIDANPAAEDFYGWNRAVLKTMRIHEINTLSSDELEQEIQQARLRENNVFYFKHRRAHEEPGDVEVYSGPISICGKELLFSIVHDDSKRIQAERDLKKLAESLEEQVQSRTRDLEAQKNKLSELNAETEAFEYSISHDLRAPLRAIAGFSSILKESMSTIEASNIEELHHLVDRIYANTISMQKLIDDMLILSRIGSRELQRQTFSLTEMAENLIEDYAKEYAHRRFEIVIEENMFACADRDLTQILLANLISNAVKFTKNSDIARIEVASTIRNGKKVYFVKDNGAGFDAKAAYPKIFVPFQRFHESSEFEGTGIGLSIVKRVVTRHDGTVEVESSPGKGATFYFNFGEEQ